jgi:hypothetical protein
VHLSVDGQHLKPSMPFPLTSIDLIIRERVPSARRDPVGGQAAADRACCHLIDVE